MAKTATRSVDLEPIDRLEEKVKLLVSLVERHEARDGSRRGREPAPVARNGRACAPGSRSSEGVATELTTLKEERDVIRTRVTDMLEQLEALSL